MGRTGRASEIVGTSGMGRSGGGMRGVGVWAGERYSSNSIPGHAKVDPRRNINSPSLWSGFAFGRSMPEGIEGEDGGQLSWSDSRGKVDDSRKYPMFR